MWLTSDTPEIVYLFNILQYTFTTHRVIVFYNFAKFRKVKFFT